MNPMIEQLHQEAKEKAQVYRQAESALIEIIIRLDQHKVFVAYGYASLYEYCLRELKLSESHASSAISVARKVIEVPQLKEEIASGNLSPAKVKKMTSVLTKENAKLWIDKAKQLSHKQLEQEVAREKPETLIQTGSTYVSHDRLALQMCVKEEFMDQLARLKDLLSQKKKANVTLEEAFEVCVEEYLERHDPIEKAERALKRVEKKKEATDANLHSPGNVKAQVKPEKPDPFKGMGRDDIKYFLRHELIYRDQGQCSHVYPNGRRCKQRRYLEMHHIRPVSQGGENSLENLTLLCSAHHKYRHLHMRERFIKRPEAQKDLSFVTS